MKKEKKERKNRMASPLQELLVYVGSQDSLEKKLKAGSD